MKSGVENPTKKSLQGQEMTNNQIRRQNSTDYKIAQAAGTSDQKHYVLAAVVHSADQGEKMS